MHWKFASLPRQPRPSGRTGFSLIELMITIVVAGILLAIAIPSFRDLILSNRLTTAANEVVAGLNVARSEAIKRNAEVDFTAQGEVTVGATPTIIRDAPEMPAETTFVINQTLVATPEGQLVASGSEAGYTGLIAELNVSGLQSNNYRCIYSATGTVLTTCSDSAACEEDEPSATCD